MAVTISKPESSFRRPFLFFLIFGLGFGWTLYIAYQQYRIKSWPQTEATILTFDPGTDHPDWDGNDELLA